MFGNDLRRWGEYDADLRAPNPPVYVVDTGSSTFYGKKKIHIKKVILTEYKKKKTRARLAIRLLHLPKLADPPQILNKQRLQKKIDKIVNCIGCNPQ